MKRSGFTLIATLITVCIICILMVVMMQGYGGIMGGQAVQRPDGNGKTTMGGAMLSADDQVCKSNLTQVRQAIEAAKISGDGNPADITGAGIGDSFYKCPVGGEPYKYDPATGEVHCVHPGHEKY